MKHFIVTFIIFLELGANGQNKVGYNYDNNGNRYQRFFIGLRPAGHDSIPALDSILNYPSQPSDAITDPKELAIEKGVNVYPNPTKDQIFVNLTKGGTKESKKADMYLFDNSGKLLDRKKYTGSEISFDLSKNPPGNYYLKILFDDQTKLNYNIVKVN